MAEDSEKNYCCFERGNDNKIIIWQNPYEKPNKRKKIFENFDFRGLILTFTAWKKFVLTEALAQRCSVKMVFLEVSQNSQENTCGRVWHRCFLVNFVKFLRTPFFIEHLCWLFLSKEKIPDNSILVTINIRFLYTNIPNKEGIEAV